MGAFGEVSSDLDRTVTALAESRVLYLSRESGKPMTEGWRSVVLGQYRRHFSVLFVKVQAACLTARLGHLGAGGRQAAGKIRDLMLQERRSQRGRGLLLSLRQGPRNGEAIRSVKGFGYIDHIYMCFKKKVES